jgi:two-component system response regulator FlrC
MSQSRTPSQGGAPTVLVVEDDSELRELVVDTLERDGYLVLTVESAAAAVEMIEAVVTPRQRIDLVLSDVRMAGTNGIELGRKVRQVRGDTPMILMTAFPEPDVYVAAAGLDAAVLAKPFHLEALRRAVLTTIAAYVRRHDHRPRDGSAD